MLQHLAPAGRLEHGLTQGPGDEARLATEAIARGFRRIVAVGGDGTWSNVGNAILKSGVPASLGLVPGGTGCDLAKTLGIPPRDVAACCRIVLDGHRRSIDVGKVEDRHFLNVAGFGYDVAVLEDSWSVSYLEGSALYVYCALRQLRSFARHAGDGRGRGTARGRARDADADRGERARLRRRLPDRTSRGPLGRQARRRGLRQHGPRRAARRDAAAAARHATSATRRSRPSRRRGSCAASRPRPSYETDGEWNRARSSELVIEAVPRALSVLVPPS